MYCVVITEDCNAMVNSEDLSFKRLAVSLRTIRFNIQKFYMVLALR